MTTEKLRQMMDEASGTRQMIRTLAAALALPALIIAKTLAHHRVPENALDRNSVAMLAWAYADELVAPLAGPPGEEAGDGKVQEAHHGQ